MIARVLEFSPSEVSEAVAALRADFAPRDAEWELRMRSHAAAVGARVVAGSLDDDRTVLVGALFTAESAVEGAALCNPSAMLHPDQSRLGSGRVRVAVSLRQIGEGHRSSIGFATAIIGPGRTWRFQPRAHPLVGADHTAGRWHRAHFRAALSRDRPLREVATAVLDALPDEFTADQLDAAIAALPPGLASRYDAASDLAAIRMTARSAYAADFAPASELSARTLTPAAAEESHGMEDARFTRFSPRDGDDTENGTEYRASYTAYDGVTISSRLIRSPDLRTFTTHRLTGPPAGNKGMAFFPRPIGGALLALSRTDGDTVSLARSEDGLHWEDVARLRAPRELWQTVQQGNCGPPIETEHGWLVLTHGVGPMRRYSVGAVLLELEHPEVVIATLTRPLMSPSPAEQNGYVPNVLYSCGGIVVHGILWIPYGVSDDRIRVASVVVDELVAAMTPVPR
ncbi:glycosylase [Microbacteriaceae bacterium VKM Ac-2854]|nr:glycosylase [Microbacteriaceae bacterium VKM Ac-2854]